MNLHIKRVLAFTIDWLIIWGVSILIFLINPSLSLDNLINPSITTIPIINILLSFLWFISSLLLKDAVFKGASIGKRICKIKIVPMNDNDTLSFGSLILRNLFLFILQIEVFVFLFNKGLRIGDLLSKTKVIQNN